MEKQTTTTTILKTVLQQKTDVKQKAKTALQICNKNGFTHNKANNKITEEGLTRLMKAMLRDIINVKKGWWNTYKVVEDKNSIQIIKKETIKKVVPKKVTTNK